MCGCRHSDSISLVIAIFVLVPPGCTFRPSTPDPALAAEAKAVTFLAREVPAWSRENRCFSCHNNGDAARALYIARTRGHQVEPSALADTTAWLAQPDRWDDNKGDPGFSDKRLANLQFASALATAVDTGRAPGDIALRVAARKLVIDQDHDGSWPIEPQNATGSPATYGTTLATFLAWHTLARTDIAEANGAREKARSWLKRAQAENVPAAATILMLAARDRAQPGAELTSAPQHFTEAFELIRNAQTRDGGWGPYADAPSEVFDTALALLALDEWRARPGVDEMILRGRRYLTERQESDGGWPATTRPPGGESYAQRLSTTGWATLALLATNDAEGRR